MKNIKNNTSISDFDDFLCKLEKKEEFACFTAHCGKVFDCDVCVIRSHQNLDTEDGQNDDEPELDTEDEQEGEHESGTEDEEDEQEGEHESGTEDEDDEQDDEDELDDEHESKDCWIVWCRGNGDNKCGVYTPSNQEIDTKIIKKEVGSK